MTQTFNWEPDSKASGTTTHRVLKAQFGDGYTQMAADGINNSSESWPVTFTDEKEVVQAIKAFLSARAGWQAFYWTPPLGEQGYYKCQSFNTKQVNGNIWQLSATFEQHFQP